MILNCFTFLVSTVQTSSLVGFLLINCLHMRPRISKLRRNVDNLLKLNLTNTNVFQLMRASRPLHRLLIQLDSFYHQVTHLNFFWQYYICSFYFTVISAIMLLSDLVFFEDVNIIGKITYSSCIILCGLLFIAVNFLSASLVCDQQLVLYHGFNSIMANFRLPLRLKYQLMLTIERLGCFHYPHQMGFTCYKFFTVDHRVMKDCLLYCLGLFLLLRQVSISLRG
jgi:hypothetical protein